MFPSTKLISAESEKIKKIYNLRSRLDSTSSFRTHMFLTAELISGQIEKIKKIAISDRAKIQPVASELPCFLVQT